MIGWEEFEAADYRSLVAEFKSMLHEYEGWLQESLGMGGEDFLLDSLPSNWLLITHLAKAAGCNGPGEHIPLGPVAYAVPISGFEGEIMDSIWTALRQLVRLKKVVFIKEDGFYDTMQFIRDRVHPETPIFIEKDEGESYAMPKYVKI